MVRPDGTPVYRYLQRPGVPAVTVTRFGPESAHANQLPIHRHAHDFLVLVYVEKGTGSFTIDGTEQPLRAGDVHAVSPGQVIGVATVGTLFIALSQGHGTLSASLGASLAMAGLAVLAQANQLPAAALSLLR